MGFLAPIGAAIMEALPALGGTVAATAGAGEAAAGLGALGTAGAGAGAGSLAAMSGIAVPSTVAELEAAMAGVGAGMGGGSLALPAATTSLGLASEEGANLAAMGLAPKSMAGDLLKQLGLSTPGSTVSSLNSGLDTMLKIKSLNQRNQHQAYAIAPNIHGGNAVPVSLGKPLARKRSPLEEFAMLLGRQ